MSRDLAVVTGASSGIGAALAPLLAREGYDLLLVARREALLEEVSAAVTRTVPEARAEPFALDLVAPGAAERLIERAPGASLVANNAGFGIMAGALEIDLETYRRMIALNVTALTELTLGYARRMAGSGGGTILNVASTAAFQPVPFLSVYAATKAYVLSLSEALHQELRGRGVNVVALCPGFTRTEFQAVAGVPAAIDERATPFAHSAEFVAEQAVRAIRRSSRTVVPGALNRIGSWFGPRAPRRLVLWSIGRVLEGMSKKAP